MKVDMHISKTKPKKQDPIYMKETLSLFNDISTFVGNLMPKPSLKRNTRGAILAYSWEDKKVHTFSKDICSSRKAITRMKVEFAFYNLARQHTKHFFMGTAF